jgi:hypothetical protein
MIRIQTVLTLTFASAMLGETPCGTFSDYVVSGSSTATFPTGIMPSRYLDLQNTVAGMDATGHSLVALENARLLPAGLADDPGIYVLIPWLSRTFRLDLATSVAIFFNSTFALAVLSGCIGFLLLCQSGISRVIGIAAVLASGALAYRNGDVYLFEFAVPMALIPFALCLIRRRSHRSNAFAVFLPAAGLACGAASLIRSSSAIATLAFLTSLITLIAVSTPKKIVLVTLLLGAFLVPRLYFQHLSSQRDVFLSTLSRGSRINTSRHIFWHLAYLGMGFLSNPYVPGGICDDAAKAKVQAIRPGTDYLSPEYDRVLRQETIAVALAHPALSLFTVFAKAGIIACLIAIFANAGLLAAIRYPKSRSIEIPFWSALAISSGPLIIAAPIPLYSIGVMSLSVIYGVVSLDWAIESRRLLHRVPIISSFAGQQKWAIRQVR